jgi:hypothetical protein
MEEGMHKLIDKIVWLGIVLVGAMLVAQLTFVKGAWAQKTDPFLIEMRAVELTKWVAANTRYEFHQPPPIVYMDAATMKRVTQNPEIVALYFPNMMVLGTDFRLGEHDHILVHELTHHLQFKAGRLKYETAACYNAHELEAYATQRRWVEEHGIGDYPDGFTLFARFGSCGGY